MGSPGSLLTTRANSRMSFIGNILLGASLLAVGACTVALAASVRRRWRSAVLVSRAITLAGFTLIPLALGVVALRASRAQFVEAKASSLARGIAEVMRCSVPLSLVVLLSAILWAIGRWRLREARRRALGGGAPQRESDRRSSAG